MLVLRFLVCILCTVRNSISARPVLKVCFRSSAKSYKFIPVKLEKMYNSRNDSFLLLICFTKCCTVNMHMQSAGRSIMASIMHINSLFHYISPRHFIYVVFQTHWMAYYFQTIIQTTVMLGVNMEFFTICSINKCLCVIVKFPSSINFQFNPHKQRTISKEANFWRFIRVRLYCSLLQLHIAVVTIWDVSIFVVIGLVVVNNSAASLACIVVIIITVVTNRRVPVTTDFAIPNSVTTVLTYICVTFQTLFTIVSSLKFSCLVFS